MVVVLLKTMGMGKHGKYTRHFKNEWKKESWAKGWLSENENIGTSYDGNEAYCLYCRTSLRAHYTDLRRHKETKIHKTHEQNRIIAKKQTVKHFFSTTSLTKEQKALDLKLSMFILHHSSIRSVDHLGELLATEDEEGGIYKKLRLHRTKCSNLIKHVIGPSYLQEIINKIGNRKFSVIIDESTDVSIIKYLAVCVRYFDGSAVITDFLGLIEVERATAIDLHASFINFFEKIGLSTKNLIAIATDGGANLCGINHSVYTLLKNDLPQLVLIKCLCHTIHLCVSKASSNLPTSLDFVAHEVYNWFKNSALRKIQYKKIYDLININENKNFKQFVKLSATRWLARYNVVKRLLDNWLELQTFFSTVGNEEKCYKAKTLSNMLQDEKIHLYFKFILPILEDCNKLNMIFQSNNYDIGSAYSQYFYTVIALARRLIRPLFLNHRDTSKTNFEENYLTLKKIIEAADNELAYLSAEYADLGYIFNQQLNNSEISNTEKTEMRERCFQFLKCLLKEFICRLPSHLKLFENVQTLNPQYCLNKEIRTDFLKLPIHTFLTKDDDINTIENQWRKLNLVHWEEQFSDNVVPDNVLEFWPIVYNFKDGSGQQIYRELATVVLRFLSLPLSNAAVERVFSILNCVKTKIRNKLKLTTLQAIIITKIYCFNRNICCKNFIPSKEMLTLFNNNIYNKDKTEDEEGVIDLLEIVNNVNTC